MIKKYVYYGYGITFNSAGSWSFDNDFVRNFISFCVENSSSSHSDNQKNNFLILGEGPTYGINGSFGSPEKKSLVLILLKQAQNFVRVCITIVVRVICLLMEKKSLNLKLAIKIVSF